MTTISYRPFELDLIPTLDELFATNQTAEACWCMWFLIPVKEFHANGGQGNKAAFTAEARAGREPMGILALDGDQTVGWCAVGPRSRFVRGVRTPTYAGRDAAEDDIVWLVPCFFTRPDRRRSGITAGLLGAAVDLAREHGARAVEGFPFAAGGAHSGSDKQVNDETVFTSQGFTVVRRPSKNRVVVRRELGPASQS
ncbi:GNAT family N-acetyltransferase [Jatrophihabitans sp.]|jgi:GNAT superfamily N-acetyltransferase|uniref:GNAT family N-acetyltransferase n=1 Tax=Jatrophihabitans sp. TaxID=1932789 RepID=UPI002F023FE9